ncbi:Glycoprotein 3-alpha-L-fucosyltransferase A [Acorus gramineus]|uniref:Fucosyltransferase n=1 Tax=Acorus gramineus TaxID=55184 RepID=A0AAV9BRW9_ACOGR|nr:Glycoprotein 3-alpha-L-fucosyltransferase A [Acorus gramineus]
MAIFASSSSLPTTNTSSGGSHGRKRWLNLLFLLFGVAFLIEMTFLGRRLDLSGEAEEVMHNWAHTFFRPTQVTPSVATSYRRAGGDGDGMRECEEWLEKVDSVNYSRDFGTDPVWVGGFEEDWSSCSVGCKFSSQSAPDKKPDAVFGLHQNPSTSTVLRSMESSHYYAENNLDQARRRGFDIIMTTSLSSDVPVGYFSWAEYDIMAPVQPKSEKALAAAFISNCGARNFRLQALDMLENFNLTIDSYGNCHRNRDGRVDKVETLKRYKFSLAFENSNEEDYVTEKFFQSLVAGSVPVVIGAPNIEEFAPSPNSILHIKELDDVATVARSMKHLATDSAAYNDMLRWKYEGPSDSFKVLVDMAAVHSSCRLCIHLATKILEKEETSPAFQKRRCQCTGSAGTVYHMYVRERGRFEMVSIFLRFGNLTLKAWESAVLAKFESMNHVPIWKKERPESIRGGDELKVYRIYPVGMTQRQALYTFRFNSDSEFRSHIEKNPCAKFEVIFV